MAAAAILAGGNHLQLRKLLIYFREILWVTACHSLHAKRTTNAQESETPDTDSLRLETERWP
jgi:hypothetical protein